jgi:hypothetical protein
MSALEMKEWLATGNVIDGRGTGSIDRRKNATARGHRDGGKVIPAPTERAEEAAAAGFPNANSTISACNKERFAVVRKPDCSHLESLTESEGSQANNRSARKGITIAIKPS